MSLANKTTQARAKKVTQASEMAQAEETTQAKKVAQAGARKMTQASQTTQQDKKDTLQKATARVHYKVTMDCRFGGMLRRAGEIFDYPQLSPIPPYLEEVSVVEQSKSVNGANENGKGKRGKKSPSLAQKAQVGKEDIGLGTPTPVSELNSSDMINV